MIHCKNDGFLIPLIQMKKLNQIREKSVDMVIKTNMNTFMKVNFLIKATLDRRSKSFSSTSGKDKIIKLMIGGGGQN